MSSDVIISVEGLGKKYHISHQGERQRYVALRDVIAGKARSLFRSRKSEAGSHGAETGSQKPEAGSTPTSVLRPPSSEDFWALKDVSFEVKRGEVVGIIGRNGAGKSTLLKILSRITEPTTGRVELDGRVASLLEVGTGFHPELTGRENIFLNGAILGMSRAEVRRKFDEIVAFAEVEKFLDTPVKRYSSGMYVRLAFAVAAHLEPEILIVDEVLAVGDAEFQKKCLGKMGEVAQGGRTVLFVSHNMSVIQALCPKVILLSSGELLFNGSCNEAVTEYLSSGALSKSIERPATRDGAPTITRLTIIQVECKLNTTLQFCIEITSRIRKRCSLELKLFNSLGIPIGFSSAGLLDPVNAIEIDVGKAVFNCKLTLPRMAGGTYRLSAQLAVPMVEVIDSTGEGVVFELHPEPLPDYERCMESTWGYGAFEIPFVFQREKHA